MKKIFFPLLILSFMLLSLEIQALQGSCMAPVNEPILYSDDFSWNMTRKEILVKFDEVYQSGKRLKNRAYLKGAELVLPINVPSRGFIDMPLPMKFMENVTKHIEAALARGYAEAIIFPDMGHSHFFMPIDFYEREIRPMDNNQKDLMYTKFFNNPDLKVLYHTAEQLRLLDEDRQVLNDRQIQWRFYTRNVVGGNRVIVSPQVRIAASHINIKGRFFITILVFLT